MKWFYLEDRDVLLDVETEDRQALEEMDLESMVGDVLDVNGREYRVTETCDPSTGKVDTLVRKNYKPEFRIIP